MTRPAPGTDRTLLVLAAGLLVAAALGALWFRADRSRGPRPVLPETEALESVPEYEVAPGEPVLDEPARSEVPAQDGERAAGDRDLRLDRTVFQGRVVDESGAPIGGARVEFVVAGWATSVEPGDCEGEVQRGALTADAEGFFRSEPIPAAGTLAIEARAPDRSPSSSILELPGGGGVTDVGELVLSSGGTVRGRIVDERGTPRPRARLFRARADSHWSGGVGRLAGEGREDGTFEILHLPIGALRLRADVAGCSSEWSAPLVVRALEPLEGVQLRVTAGQTLRGRLVDRHSGAGVAGEVKLWSPGGERASCSVTSDGEGNFLVKGLELEQSFGFQASAPGWGYSTQEGGWGGPNVLTLTSELLRNGWTIPMARALVPSLVVLDARDRQPIAGAELALSGASRLQGLLERSTDVIATADAAGAIQVPEHRSRSGLQVQASGFVPKRVAPYASSAPLEIELDPGWSLLVEVLDSEGAPAEAEVVLQAFDRREVNRPFVSGGLSLQNPAFAPLARGRARPGQPARFAALPGFEYRVQAVGDDQARAVTTHRLAQEAVEERIALQLAPPASLEGTVRMTLSSSGRFLVLALSEDGFVEGAVSDGRGVFSIAGLGEGTYRVSASLLQRGTSPHALEFPKYYRQTAPEVEVRLAPGERRSIVMEGFSGTGSLAGTVRLNGQPQGSLRVDLEWIRPEENEGAITVLSRSVWTDGHGVFALDELEAGRWRALTRSAGVHGLELAGTEIEIRPQREESCDLEASVGTLLLTTVSDRVSREPRGWQHLELLTSSGDAVGSIDTPGSGRREVADMPAGTWRLATYDAEPKTLDFEIRPGETTEVAFPVGE